MIGLHIDWLAASVPSLFKSAIQHAYHREVHEVRLDEAVLQPPISMVAWWMSPKWMSPKWEPVELVYTVKMDHQSQHRYTLWGWYPVPPGIWPYRSLLGSDKIPFTERRLAFGKHYSL